MKVFNHESASSFEDARELLKSTGNNVMIAGGTDLLGVLKADILPQYPDTVIDLKTIEGTKYIKLENGVMSIGALTKLKDIVECEAIKTNFPMLTQASKSVATPLIRNTATIGGNICQDVRCWFYRYPQDGGGRLVCSRKGGDICYALQGENRYHSIFGGMKANCIPCTHECPAGTDIPAYMAELRKGNVDAAANIIMKVNPIPMITSRVCAHFCQEGCNRGNNDESVAIGNVERYVGDYILNNAEKFYPAPSTTTGKTVAIIGSGPSGLAAAFYLRKAGNDVTVYEKMPKAGGMLTYAIPAYRLPKDCVQKLITSLEGMGIQFVLNTDIGTNISPDELENKYSSLFYDTGAWKRPIIGLEGEDLTVFGLDFLMQVNQWMVNKVGTDVLVTGGGNVAMDVAITAKRLGAKTVTMACVECEKEMPASKEEIARAKEEGIIIMPSYGLSKVISEGNAVKGMELVRCISVRDEKGAFNPQYDQNEKITVNADSILMAIGQKVDLSFLGEKYELALKRGLIEVAEETQQTSRPGVFAGGDATTGPSTVVKAVAAGLKGANGINEYLNINTCNCCSGKDKNEDHYLQFSPVGINKKNAAKMPEVPMAERTVYIEDAMGIGSAGAIEEATRCLNCGCYAVNPSDIAPVLVALEATIQTNLREITAREFCAEKLTVAEVLQEGEIVTEIRIPLIEGAIMSYDKFRVRESVDFAIVSVASIYSAEKGKIKGARIVLGGVAPTPLRANAVEGYLIGKEITTEMADKAAEIAVKDAIALEKNEYKIQEVKALVKASILRIKE